MTFRIEFHGEVSKDYNEAYDWYEQQKPGLGERFLSAVRTKLEQVALHPETYGQKTKKGYREARLDDFPFIIVYKIYYRNGVILINALHHQSKHPRKKFRR